MSKQKSLGKNIDELFKASTPSKSSASKKTFEQEQGNTTAERVSMLFLETLVPSPHQPRRVFDEAKLQELADSITQQGIIQPIIVVKAGEGLYSIVAGERRFRAAQLAKIKKIPAIIRDYSGKESALATVIENIQREDLNPLERAQGFSKILNEFKLKQQDVASMLGISRTQLTNSLRLLKLDLAVQDWIAQGCLTEGHGKILAGLEDQDQVRFAQYCINEDWSVRRLELELERADAQEEAENPVKNQSKKQNQESLDIERALEEAFMTKVKLVDSGQGKGKVVVYYHSYEELDGLLYRFKVKDANEIY